MHAGRPRTAGKHSSRSHHVPTPDKISGCGCSTSSEKGTLAAVDGFLRVPVCGSRVSPRNRPLVPLVVCLVKLGDRVDEADDAGLTLPARR